MAARVEGEDGVPLADSHPLCHREPASRASDAEAVHEDDGRPAAGGGGASGSVSVAASGVPSADVIVTS